MPPLIDPLSIFTNDSLSSAPRLILRADFNNCTIGAPTYVSPKNYNQTITFGDMNAAAMDDFFDSGYVLRLQSIIDREAVDAADFTSTLENSIKTVVGPFGDNVSVLYQHIKNRFYEPGQTSIVGQTWLNILRNAPGSAPASNIDSIFVSYWRKSQVEGALPLDQFLVHGHASGVAFWRSEFEIKSGGYLGSEGGGDYRVSHRTEQDGTGLYWKMRGDNSAANTTVPGVSTGTTGPAPEYQAGGQQTYWNGISRTPAVSSDAWEKVEIFIDRHRVTNRSYAAITQASTGLRTIISDLSVAGSLRAGSYLSGAQEGLYGLPWSQIFLVGLYADGVKLNYPLNQYVYDLQVWNAPPHLLT